MNCGRKKQLYIRSYVTTYEVKDFQFNIRKIALVLSFWQL